MFERNDQHCLPVERDVHCRVCWKICLVCLFKRGRKMRKNKEKETTLAFQISSKTSKLSSGFYWYF